MGDNILTILSIILMSAGLLFFTTATIGILRFPDFYSRMHAVSKSDTLGALLLLSGISLYNLTDGLTLSSIVLSVKILLIAVVIFIANPTACHAITKAAFEVGVLPWKKQEDKNDDMAA